ncbi:MAG TPA: helix-turn-helix domain-containing protein [Streptosporangiaceae bacterium]|nr:helix-turn-helix domain-containing protein [Streptosporangiaceae bacterium]
MTHGATGSGHGYQGGQMPNALRIGLLGPLQVRDETGRPVRVGGRQLRVLLTLLALNAGRVVPAGSLAGHIWPDDPPGNPGNALQTLVSRLRAELRPTRWPNVPGPCSCARCTRPAARRRRSRATTRAASCSPTGSAWTRRPSSSRST